MNSRRFFSSICGIQIGVLLLLCGCTFSTSVNKPIEVERAMSAKQTENGYVSDIGLQNQDIDEKVYSSAETFAMFCKDTGFATLVGTITGGNGGELDPLYLALPHSGFIFRFNVLYTLNSDGTCNAETGTKPDIYILPKQNALQICLDRIC